MTLSEGDTHCPEWDSSPPVLPPRSRLDCMEPIGCGTQMVESLSGYVARLADSHSTSAAILFGWEIAPYLKTTRFQQELFSSNKSKILAASFRSVAGAMNGTGVTAQR